MTLQNVVLKAFSTAWQSYDRSKAAHSSNLGNESFL